MKRLLIAAIFVLALTTACQSETPTPTLTPTETVQVVPTDLPTLEPTNTSTPTPQPTEAPTVTPTPVPNDMWVSAPNGLNLRAEGKATAAVSATLTLNQHLIAIGSPVGPDSGGIIWQQVRTDAGVTGWVAANVQGAATLTTTKPGTTPTPVGATPGPAITATASSPISITGDVWVAATNGLNLRTQSNSTATLVATLSNGAHLSAIGAAVGPDSGGITWQQVRTDAGQTGWVASVIQGTPTLTTVKPGASTPTASTPTPITPAATVTGTTPITGTVTGNAWVNAANGLNLRAQASATAALITTLPNGTHLTKIDTAVGPDSGGVTWQEVRNDNGQTGWVDASFLTTVAPAGTTTPTAPVSTGAGTATDLLSRITTLRAQHNLNPYTLVPALSAIAQTHSQYMADNQDITHTGADGTTPAQRITGAGYGNGQPVENIYGGASLDDAWTFWITDPTHLADLLNTKDTVIGIGIVTRGSLNYYTIDIGVPLE